MLQSFEIGSKAGRFLFVLNPVLYSLHNFFNGVDIVRTFVIEYPNS